MPGTEHEAIAELLARRPELLTRLTDTPLPSAARVEPVDSALSPPLELRADKVFIARDQGGRALAAIVCEVQRRRDEDKRYTWPAYTTAVRVRERCDAVLFVIALSTSVEAWASAPIDVGGGNHFSPVVLGPTRVPKITEPAAGVPWELGVLSAIVHARSPEAVDIAVAALELAREQAKIADQALYCDLISSKLSPRARRALRERLRTTMNYEPQSAIFRHWKRVGVKEGLEKGLGRGLERGRQEGREEGLLRSVLLILEARGLPVSAATQRRLAATHDARALARLVKRAAVVARASQLFSAARPATTNR